MILYLFIQLVEIGIFCPVRKRTRQKIKAEIVHPTYPFTHSTSRINAAINGPHKKMTRLYFAFVTCFLVYLVSSITFACNFFSTLFIFMTFTF